MKSKLWLLFILPAVWVIFFIITIQASAGLDHPSNKPQIRITLSPIQPTPLAPGSMSITISREIQDAGQLAVGAEVYRLVCSACHGDKGQGLTAEWISTWPPEDQNCWRSKCHSSTHPPEGFIFPKYAPALAGTIRLQRFKTAQELFEYNNVAMPWYAAGALVQEQTWAVTAHILKLNEINLDGEILDETTAAQIALHSDSNFVATSMQPTATSQPDTLPSESRPSLYWIIFPVLILLAAAVFIWQLRKQSN